MTTDIIRCAEPQGSDPEVVLSLSRLLSRILSEAPTGVDRVELAYARGLLDNMPDRLRFSAVNPLFKRYGRLSPWWVRRYLDWLERRWRSGSVHSAVRRRIEAFWWLVALWPRRVPRRVPGIGRVYLQSSPDHLDRQDIMDAILAREAAAFVCLVHDLIPIDFPEYARPDAPARHRLRIRTIVNRADGILANSTATLHSLTRFFEPGAKMPQMHVAHLGTLHAAPATSVAPPASPYFLCLGTIEPRKNHLLLLNIWRRLAEESPTGIVPHLAIVGRRGWENENVVDMLDRCPAMQMHVTEFNDLPDAETARLTEGAQALLMPSFAEGFGMPVAEALQRGVPVLCSDLPALREVGGDVPEYLDPLDGPSWIDAVRDYARPDSIRRAQQCARMADWKAPTWEAHMDIVQSIVQRVA